MHLKSTQKRLSAKEVSMPKKVVKMFIFLVADGTVKLSGGDEVLETSTLIPDSPDREARNDFLSMSGNFIFRHHVEPRVKHDVSSNFQSSCFVCPLVGFFARG